MLANRRRARNVSRGWSSALDQYRRLCADPEAGPYNASGAVIILQDALPLYAPKRQAILEVIAAASTPVSPIYISHALKMGYPPPSTVSTTLISLYDEGLLDREWLRHGSPLGGGKYVYMLSNLGQMVMEFNGSPNGTHDDTENGRS